MRVFGQVFGQIFGHDGVGRDRALVYVALAPIFAPIF